MKKILILAYDFPPYNSIGGQRPYAWLRYFKEFGLHPVVITRHWDRPIDRPEDCHLPSIEQKVTTEETEYGTIVRAPFIPQLRDRLVLRTDIFSKALRKTLSFLQLLTEHHFGTFDNRQPLFRAAKHFLKSNEVEMIIACGEPFILFSYADRLGREFNIPWMGDYRDGWSTNYTLDRGGLYALIQKTWQRRSERQLVSRAAALTTAAPDFSAQLKNTFHLDNEPPVIYNGYFEEKFSGLETTERKHEFTIAHAGTVYDFQRVETFLDGMNRFLSAHPQHAIKVIFYGLHFFPEQMTRIRKSSGKADVMFTDRMPHEDMLRELAASHVQLLLATPEKRQIYAKVFDYMATGRPIMLVENDHGPLEEMLKDRPNARICGSATDVSKTLEHYFNDADSLDSIPNKDDTFTRRNQTRRMAEVVLKTIGKR